MFISINKALIKPNAYSSQEFYKSQLENYQSQVHFQDPYLYFKASTRSFSDRRPSQAYGFVAIRKRVILKLKEFTVWRYCVSSRYVKIL